MSDIRERAISFARKMGFPPDVTATMESAVHISTDVYSPPCEEYPPDCIIIKNPVQFRIGIDNMIAAGFEMGYAAAVDDRVPARALRDEPRKPRAERVARLSVKRRK